MKRLLFLLLAFVSISVGAQEQIALGTTQHTRPRWVLSGPGNSSNNGCCASFVLPLNDLGAGAVNTTPAFSLGSGTPTFTRATTAWTKLSTGLWASVASGTARSGYLSGSGGYDTSVGVYGGYFTEGARTNDLLWNRDWTNVAWTKVNVTAAKTATGIDGAANSATLLTATANNGTICQAITLASQADTGSAFIERVTGTGAVSLAIDAATYTAITINSSNYVQGQVTQTVLNPTLCLKFATSGDQVNVDMGQLEPGGFASSPIPTTTVAVTRNADVLSYPSAGNIRGTVGTAYAEIKSNVASGVNSANATVLYVGSQSRLLYISGSSAATTIATYDSTNIVGQTGLDDSSLTVAKRIASWGGTVLSVTGNGVAPATGTFSGNNSASQIALGGIGAVESFFGTIRNVTIWPGALSQPYLQVKTTDAADFLGSPFWRMAANDDFYRKAVNQ